MRLWPRRPLPRFALRALLWLALLLLLPGTREVYVPAFHAQANALFRVFGPERAVRLSAPEDASDGSDTRMVGFDRGRLEPRFEARFPIFGRSFAPVAGVAALILAMPLPLWRRLAALVAGVLALQAFALALTAFLAWTAFGAADAGAETQQAWQRASRMARELFNQELPRLIVVLLVWAVLTQPGRSLSGRAGAAARAPVAPAPSRKD